MKKTYIFAAVSILLWSTLSTITKLLLLSLDSYFILCASAFFAFISLFILNIIKAGFGIFKKYCLKDYLIMILIGLPGTFFYYIFLYEGTARMPASAAFILNYLWPIMSVVFACILIKERLTVRKTVAFILSFAGVFTVAGEELFISGGGSILGVLCCLGAAISYGLFTALGQKYNYDSLFSMMVSFLVSFILSLTFLLIKGTYVHLKPIQLVGIAYNGIFIMAVATVTWALALNSGKTAKISNLAYITPFLSLIWTFIFLKEQIKPLSVTGLIIIILGIFIQIKDEKIKKSIDK